MDIPRKEKILGEEVLITEELIRDEFFEGGIGYHLRKGLHYFSREDWLKLIRFVKLHRNS